MVLEPGFQTADMQRRHFPWRSVATFGVMTFLAGLAIGLALLARDTLGTFRLLSVVVVATLVVSWSWRFLRGAVIEWQEEFARDVEYVARRVREHEAHLRFQSP